MTELAQFEEVGDGLLVRAPAKINLSLLVVGKQPDGYHEIETLMAKVDYYDELFFQPGQTRGLRADLRGRYCAGGRGDLVGGRAVHFDVVKADTGVRVTLRKNAPAGSGLGSASSDAAGADGAESLCESGGQSAADRDCMRVRQRHSVLSGAAGILYGPWRKIEGIVNFFRSVPFCVT